MITAGAFEAKTHFSQLLNKVMNGETVTITRHGQGVALLIPIPSAKTTKNSAQHAIDTIRDLRKGVTLGENLSIKHLREEGRK
jgi:prevent-host-death family protein